MIESSSPLLIFVMFYAASTIMKMVLAVCECKCALLTSNLTNLEKDESRVHN